MKIAEQIIEHCISKQFTIGAAESCTGGHISSLITQISGASECYEGGLVTYATKQKVHLLKVSSTIIEQYGVVSNEVAQAMAVGAVNLLGVDFAVATTGIAGPKGGTPEVPCGTVCIGIANQKAAIAKQYLFNGDRQSVIQAASGQALKDLYQVIVHEGASLG